MNSYKIIAGSHYVTASQEDNTLKLSCPEEDLSFWMNYFDLDTDYESYITKINPNDTYLCQAVQSASGVRILRQDLWEMIVTFLVSQQNNINRIRRCIRLLCENYGDYVPIPDDVFMPHVLNDGGREKHPLPELDGRERESGAGGFYTFPGPEAFSDLPEDALMACNLGYRSKYVVRSARQIINDQVCLDNISQLPYKKAKEELLKLYGVGEKVADCICLFSRHDLDAFPIDTHIRQALDTHYKRGFPNRRYKGFRGVIQQYIFCYELWN